jgi:predicted dehydrogenase
VSAHRAPLGLGVVGLGNAGRQHLAAVADLPALRLVAVADPVAQAPVGIRHYADAHDLLDSPDVDVVALCTPPGPRAQLALKAVAAGKPMLVEKPVARSVAEFDELVAGIAAGLSAAVMLQHRMRLPEALLQHDWGSDAVGVLEVSRPRSPAHFVASAWRRDADAAYGGVTAHLGIHYLDLACQLLGDVSGVELSEVAGPHPGIDTRATGTVTFVGGALLHFSVTSERSDRYEHLTITSVDGELQLVDGLVQGRLPGADLVAGPPRTVQSLRTDVYAEFAAAVGNEVQPARCGLASAGPVTRIVAHVAEALATLASGAEALATGAAAPALAVPP